MKLGISKEQFCGVIKKLQVANELREKIDNLYREAAEDPYCRDFNYGSLEINHEPIVIDLLKLLTHDIDNIEYFVYELDFGKKYTEGCVTLGDGTICDISTAEKLYNELEKAAASR